MDLGLAGKVAIVTGGSRGIGRCIALALAAEGCHLAVCGRAEDVLHRTASEVAALGHRVVSVAAGLTKCEEAERFVEQTIAEFGGVDLLVANAGGSSGGSLVDATAENWRRTFDLTLFHAVSATRTAVPSMRERGGGSVVFIASISGRKPVHRRWQYGAAKAALIHTARCLALEARPSKYSRQLSESRLDACAWRPVGEVLC